MSKKLYHKMLKLHAQLLDWREDLLIVHVQAESKEETQLAHIVGELTQLAQDVKRFIDHA